MPAIGDAQGKRIRLTIKASEPKREGNEYEVILVAELTPIASRERLDYASLFIQFRQQRTTDLEGPTPIDDNTRTATVTATDLTSGSYIFSAQLLDQGSPGIEDTVRVSIQGPTVVLPDTFDAWDEGRDGYPRFRFTVSPAVKSKGTIVEEGTDNIYSIETDESGVGVYPDPAKLPEPEEAPNDEKVATGEEHVLIHHTKRTKYLLHFPNKNRKGPEQFPLEAPQRHLKPQPEGFDKLSFRERWTWRWKNKRGWRWLACCLGSAMLFVGLLMFCTSSSSFSRTPQITLDEYKVMRPTAQALTQIMRSRHGLPAIPQEEPYIHNFVCGWLWLFWWSSLICCFLYSLKVFSYEVAVVWRRAVLKTIRERRQGDRPAQAPTQGQVVQVPGQTGTNQPIVVGQGSFWREVKAAILGEFASEGIFSFLATIVRHFR